MAYKLLTDDETNAGSHCFYIAFPSHTLADFQGMSSVACKYKQWWVGVVFDVV